MIDIKIIRETPDIVKKAVKEKKLEDKVNVDELIDIDSQYRDLLVKVEEHRNLRNTLSEDISKVDGDARTKLIAEATNVKEELTKMETELNELDEKRIKLLMLVPNIISEDVPLGIDDTENVVIRKWGEPKEFDFDIKDHMELGEELDIIDVKTSAKVSGSRFNYLKNSAVMLQFALIQFVFDALTDEKIVSELCKKVGLTDDRPFTPVLPPVMVRGDVAKKMDRFDPIEDRYYFEEDDTMLVGSAEHSMGPMFMDETIDEVNLPIRYIGYSTAFRREAGTYGKDTQGILRRHQFDKLEMEIFSLPENGGKEQELAVAVQEYILQRLEIPYQVVQICTGDMGKPDYKQIDIECWLPGQNMYRETHTSDYMTDFQARRLNTRYKKLNGETGYVHMNDATALAIGRILIAIIENYQHKDGSVSIPDILQKYMGEKKTL